MPLITGSGFDNPVAKVMPPVPKPSGAKEACPEQGDHVFGDVLGVVENALKKIFGGGDAWGGRMAAYNVNMLSIWGGLVQVDYGHGQNPPIVARSGVKEYDEHAHVFGEYSKRLQWALCEITCAGFYAGLGESRQIGGYSKKWKKEVLNCFDDLLAHLVDSTALEVYISCPGGIRKADPLTVRHKPMSLAAASFSIMSKKGPGKARIQTLLASYSTLRTAFEGLIGRFDSNTKTLTTNTTNETWV